MHPQNTFTACPDCNGSGKQKRRIKKKIQLRYQKQLEVYEKSNFEGVVPVRPEGTLMNCPDCFGSGIIAAENFPTPNENFPHVAIVGAGIGGIALAIGCLHRGIPFTIFERDASFNDRSQGYGLTLQQAK